MQETLPSETINADNVALLNCYLTNRKVLNDENFVR
jgi:hypothetical protein